MMTTFLERLVKMVEPLSDVCIIENENAMFSCILNEKDVDVCWYLNDIKLSNTNYITIENCGNLQTLLLLNVQCENKGVVMMVAENLKVTAQITSSFIVTATV